jgi:hypothetical protein
MQNKKGNIGFSEPIVEEAEDDVLQDIQPQAE